MEVISPLSMRPSVGSAGDRTVVERDSNVFIVPCQSELDIPALYLVHPLGQIKAQGQCNGAGGLLCLNRVLLAAGRGNGGQPSGTGGTYQSQTQQARGQSSKLVQIVHPFQSFVHCAVKPPVPNPDGLGPTAFTTPHYTGSAHQFQRKIGNIFIFVAVVQMNVNTHCFCGYLDDEKLFFPSAKLPRCKKLFHLCNNNCTNVCILLHLFAIYFLKIFFFPLLIFCPQTRGAIGLFYTSLYVMSFICYLAGSPGNHTRYFQYGRTAFKA